jgi:adenine/guanine phosphoribosyltransferase-like PRPP-binding protein
MIKQKLLDRVRESEKNPGRARSILMLALYRLYKRTMQMLRANSNPAASKLFLQYQNFERNLLSGKMVFVSNEQMVGWVDEWSRTLPRDIDVVVGIPRSGLLIAALLATRLGKPLSTPDLFMEDKYWLSNRIQPNEARRVLLVEDSVRTGDTLRRHRAMLETKADITITTAALIASKAQSQGLDYFFRIIDNPRLFEWNMIHAKNVKVLATDLDGVLCEDCPAGHDDDEEAYLAWLERARPYFIPTFEIDAVITNRLERYRPQTERWLRDNGVRYRELLMWDLESKADREGRYAANKVTHLMRLKPDLYWESNAGQARAIWEAARIPTLSVEDKALYAG